MRVTRCFVRIDMYTDGTQDLMAMIMQAAFKPPEEKEENVALIVTKAKTRYFPVFEKVGCRDLVWSSARPPPSVARGGVVVWQAS